MGIRAYIIIMFIIRVCITFACLRNPVKHCKTNKNWYHIQSPGICFFTLNKRHDGHCTCLYWPNSSQHLNNVEYLKCSSPRVCCHPEPRVRRGWGGADRGWMEDHVKAWKYLGSCWHPSWGDGTFGPGYHYAESGGKSASFPPWFCIQLP